MTKTVDPFAGSYVVESMTDEIEAAALELMQAVEDKGGAVAAIEQGFQKSEIERSRLPDRARDRQRRAHRRRRSTGSGSTTRSPTSRCASTRRSRPTRWPGSRPCAPTATTPPSTAALGALRKRPRGTDNVLYPMKEALRPRATGGEVAHALREVWGTYVPRDAF